VAKSKITYSKTAIKQLSRSLEYIREDSIQNAEKVYRKILDKLEKASLDPEINPPDKYKIANDGNYRAFVLFRYRISYRIMKNQILVLRIRHTSMNTKYY
jgi:plasmid stabilization system protein ParE